MIFCQNWDECGNERVVILEGNGKRTFNQGVRHIDKTCIDKLCLNGGILILWKEHIK